MNVAKNRFDDVEGWWISKPCHHNWRINLQPANMNSIRKNTPSGAIVNLSSEHCIGFSNGFAGTGYRVSQNSGKIKTDELPPSGVHQKTKEEFAAI